MTPEAMDIVERLLKAAVFVPIIALVAWWIFTSLLDNTLSPGEAAVGFGLLGAASLLGVISIIRGGWGFLGVLALVYVAGLGLVAWEYVYWRRSEQQRLLADIEKYQETIARDPRNAAAYSFLGETYLRLRSFDEAGAALQKALELAPESKRDLKLLKLARERRSGFRWRRLD